MNSEFDALIAQAISALKLRDIILQECSLRRPTQPPNSQEPIEASQLVKREVRFVLGDAPSPPGESTRLLQVIVALGIRLTGSEPEGEEAPIYFEIEADFLAEYLVKSEISEQAIKAFADFNAVHNVWPFWRQHVFDIVGRARLPQLEIPLFSGSAPSVENGAKAE